mmetsp:Transcript_57986/g.132478  ORF Transcript_57986/g.132478 Transcript_57986/m.132478 type:complete len:272 (-) Transcript_57986:1494-2309(-)
MSEEPPRGDRDVAHRVGVPQPPAQLPEPGQLLHDRLVPRVASRGSRGCRKPVLEQRQGPRVRRCHQDQRGQGHGGHADHCDRPVREVPGGAQAVLLRDADVLPGADQLLHQHSEEPPADCAEGQVAVRHRPREDQRRQGAGLRPADPAQRAGARAGEGGPGDRRDEGARGTAAGRGRGEEGDCGGGGGQGQRAEGHRLGDQGGLHEGPGGSDARVRVRGGCAEQAVEGRRGRGARHEGADPGCVHDGAGNVHHVRSEADQGGLPRWQGQGR